MLSERWVYVMWWNDGVEVRGLFLICPRTFFICSVRHKSCSFSYNVTVTRGQTAALLLKQHIVQQWLTVTQRLKRLDFRLFLFDERTNATPAIRILNTRSNRLMISSQCFIWFYLSTFISSYLHFLHAVLHILFDASVLHLVLILYGMHWKNDCSLAQVVI